MELGGKYLEGKETHLLASGVHWAADLDEELVI